MLNRNQKKRFWNLFSLVCICAGLIIIGLFIIGREYLIFCYTPSEFCNLTPDKHINQMVRVGGKVVTNSIVWKDGILFFEISDHRNTLKVMYKGAVPGLFKEDQEVIAEGVINECGYFKANRILAKHDEYYRPKKS